MDNKEIEVLEDKLMEYSKRIKELKNLIVIGAEKCRDCVKS